MYTRVCGNEYINFLAFPSKYDLVCLWGLVNNVLWCNKSRSYKRHFFGSRFSWVMRYLLYNVENTLLYLEERQIILLTSTTCVYFSNLSVAHLQLERRDSLCADSWRPSAPDSASSDRAAHPLASDAGTDDGCFAPVCGIWHDGFGTRPQTDPRINEGRIVCSALC